MKVHQELQQNKICNTHIHQLGSPQLFHVADDRPVVCVLPDQIGQDDEKSQQQANTEIFRTNQMAIAREQQGEQEREHEKNDGVFVQKRQSPQNPQMKPIFWILALHQLDDKIAAERPGKLLEGDRLEERIAAQ